MFAYVNPVQLNLDPLTVLWLNAFSLNLEQSVKSMSLEKGEPPYLDVKVEAIMFKVIGRGVVGFYIPFAERQCGLHTK